MPTKCLKPVRGRRFRLTRLDGCGRPVFGEASQVVSNGIVSVAMTMNTSETAEINVTNAAGEVCVFDPAQTLFTSISAVVTFCEVDPDLFALVTGQEVRTDAFGNAVGFAISTDVDQSASGFALEIWTGFAGGGACATEGAQGSFGYILLPFIRGGIVGDHTIENGEVTFTITGGTTRDGNAWGVGPYSDVQLTATSVPGPLVQPLAANDHYLLIGTEVAPPEAACGARPLLDPSLPALTAVSGTAVGLDVDFEVTPVATGPVWYDFGDGEWDYVAAPGEASHTYDAAGTYTVRASQNGTWVTATVTVAAP